MPIDGLEKMLSLRLGELDLDLGCLGGRRRCGRGLRGDCRGQRGLLGDDLGLPPFGRQVELRRVVE